MSRAAYAGMLWLAVACAACAGELGVEFDPAENFSAYRSWDWLPRGSEPLEVRGVDSSGLHELILAHIARELEQRGYARDPEAPDFFVTYHAEIRRELKVATDTPAPHFIASLNNTPSYEVTAGKRSVQAFDTGTLAIDLADGRDKQLVWRGAYERRVRGSFRPHLEGAVERILEKFPPMADSVALGD